MADTLTFPQARLLKLMVEHRDKRITLARARKIDSWIGYDTAIIVTPMSVRDKLHDLGLIEIDRERLPHRWYATEAGIAQVGLHG